MEEFWLGFLAAHKQHPFMWSAIIALAWFVCHIPRGWPYHNQ